jgi:hypothetical protein
VQSDKEFCDMVLNFEAFFVCAFVYVQLQLMAQVYFSVEYPTFHYAVIRCNE